MAKTKAEEAEGAKTLLDGVNGLTARIIAAAIEIHRHLGPGLLESAYQECLCYEFCRMGIGFKREVALPIKYKGLSLDCSYRLDFLVEDAVIVEIKCVDAILPVHSAQLLTYLKAANKRIGLLINFNVPMLKDGIKRMVNRYREPSAEPITSASSATGADEPGAAEFLSSSLRFSPRPSVSAVNRSSH